MRPAVDLRPGDGGLGVGGGVLRLLLGCRLRRRGAQAVSRCRGARSSGRQVIAGMGGWAITRIGPARRRVIGLDAGDGLVEGAAFLLDLRLAIRAG